jgi:peptidoglycan/xylan/chitin deacetylase (PgdA/CDA1 family)
MKKYCLFFCVSFFLFGFGCTSKPIETELVADEITKPIVETADSSTDISFVSIEETFLLPVLLFHHISTPPDGLSESAKQWYVSEEKFEEVLLFLQEHDWHPIVVSELMGYLGKNNIPEHAIILTFDDGAADFYTTAFPLLKKYDTKSVMHIMTSVHSDNWMTAKQIQELDATGLVEFGSHTKYHEYLTRVSTEKARKEMEESKASLEKLLEKPVYSIGYPFGLYDESIMSLAKELEYTVGFSLRSGFEQDREEMLEMKRTIITENTNISDLLF